MSQLVGDGAVETYCTRCGFAVRQRPGRPSRQPSIRRAWLAHFGDTDNAQGQQAFGSRLRVTPLWVPTLFAYALLVVAVRALYVGYPSFEPVLFAELYVWLFSVFMLGIPTLVWTARRVDGKQWFMLVAVALAGAVILGRAAPTIGEPNYCGELVDYPSYSIDWRLPPKIFRCTSLPLEMTGWFGGWWLALWLLGRWERRGGGSSRSAI